MTRRVLQIIPTLDRSSAARQLVQLAKGLPRDEFEVHVCTLERAGALAADLQAAGIPLHVVGQPWTFDPFTFWKLRQYIRQLKPDLVQTWTFVANTYGRLAARSADVGTIVATQRSADPAEAERQKWVDRWLARRTDAIVVNGRAVQALQIAQGIAPSKLRLIPDGVEPAAPSPTTHADLLAEFGLPPGAKLIGAVGRLCHQKRLKDLIWATDLIKVIRDDVHLLIIGEGTQRRNLERFRDNCRIRDKAHFLGERADIPRLMPHFELLWLASDFEGVPNVVLEAMACGLPIVATDIEGNRELVTHGQNGFLVPLGDRAGLGRCANKILQDAALRQRLGEASRVRVSHDFTVAAMVERHAALYRELLDR